ncbi:MAG: Ubiquitin-conjugating enzyme E2 4, partial [Marteilia pararefringens]
MYSGLGGGSNSLGNSDSPSSLSPKSHATLRREKDVYKLSSKYKINFINGTKEFLVNFRGPIGSPYDGGYWAIKIDMPDSYPFKSPSVGFINRIYHPNVDEASGSICLDVISHKWSPIFDLSHIFDHFLPQLLQEPNTGDPLNLVAAQHCFKDHPGFCQRVSEYIKKYATPEEIATIMCTMIPNPPPRETLIAQFASINPQPSNSSGNKKRDRLTDDPCLEITQDDGLGLSLNSSSASLSKYNSTTQ